MNRYLAIVGLATCLQALAQQPPPPIKQAPKGPRASLDPSLPAYDHSVSVSGHVRSVGARIMQVAVGIDHRGNVVSMEGRTSIMELWREAFAKVQPNVQISLESERRYMTMRLFEGRPDVIGNPAREMLPDDVFAFEGKFGYKPTEVCVLGGSWKTPSMTFAIAIFVNKTNPIERLTLDQLDSIYSRSRKRGQEEIRTWGQLGLKGEWANRPIRLYGLLAPGNTPGGIENFLRRRILLGGFFRDGITYYADGRRKLVEAVGQDPSGLGYSGFAEVEANPDVKSVALAETQAGPYYKGSFEEVASRRYPLTRFVYIYVNRAPGKPVEPAVREFLRFVLSKEGQQVVQEEGHWLPLPAEIVKQERAKLE